MIGTSVTDCQHKYKYMASVWLTDAIYLYCVDNHKTIAYQQTIPGPLAPSPFQYLGTTKTHSAKHLLYYNREKPKKKNSKSEQAKKYKKG